MIILKDLPIRDKKHLRTVRLPGRLDIRFLRDDRLTIFHPLTLSVTVAGYQEITTQGIHAAQFLRRGGVHGTEPFKPTDFLNALLSYLAPVFILLDTSTTLPRGTPRP